MTDAIAPITSRYARYAMTSDGLPEIESFTYLPFESDFPDPQPAQRLVIVLVEPRLLANSGKPGLSSSLLQQLRRF